MRVKCLESTLHIKIRLNGGCKTVCSAEIDSGKKNVGRVMASQMVEQCFALMKQCFQQNLSVWLAILIGSNKSQPNTGN